MFDLGREAAFIAAGRPAFDGPTVIFTAHDAASLAIADRVPRVCGAPIEIQADDAVLT